MYECSTRLIRLVVVFTFAFGGPLMGQAPTGASTSVLAGNGTLHGQISDPSGAMIQGAAISISNASGVTAMTASSDASRFGYQVVSHWRSDARSQKDDE